MTTAPLIGDAIVPGRATGELLAANVGISFWGGVDAVSGTVIDCHHPLHGQSIAGKILAIPNGRGSCTGSQVVLELLLAGQAPAAILMRRPDEIIALGVIVAEELFGRSLPVVSLGEEGFARLVSHSGPVAVDGAHVSLGGAPPPAAAAAKTTTAAAGPVLSAEDEAMLNGAHGRAVQVAMSIIARMATLQRAPALIDVSQVHIDGTVYIGPASLRFAQKMVRWGGARRMCRKDAPGPASAATGPRGRPCASRRAASAAVAPPARLPGARQPRKLALHPSAAPPPPPAPRTAQARCGCRRRSTASRSTSGSGARSACPPRSASRRARWATRMCSSEPRPRSRAPPLLALDHE